MWFHIVCSAMYSRLRALKYTSERVDHFMCVSMCEHVIIYGCVHISLTYKSYLYKQIIQEDCTASMIVGSKQFVAYVVWTRTHA